MSGALFEAETRRKMASLVFFLMMLLPTIVTASSSPFNEDSPTDEKWWMDTSMDLDGDFVHDAIWIAAQNNQHDYLDENGRISVIVDFDHTPTEDDEKMLSSEVDFELEFRYWLIDSIAGTVELNRIHELVDLPGVVFVELDGILGIQMEDVVPAHGVDLVWQDTGYTGEGVTMAIIDTGIDGNHTALDDLDDDLSLIHI